MTNYLGAKLRYPESARYDGEDADEKLILVLRQSYLTTIPWLFVTAILFTVPGILVPFFRSFKVGDANMFGYDFIFVVCMFWYLFSSGYLLQNFLNWFFNLYIISSKKIIDVDFHGILYKNISETTLDNIEDVTSTVTGTLGVIFNIGHVFIQTAGETREFDFINLDDPASVRDLIADLSAKKRKNDNN